ncbi:alanyl-tRNA synthetase [Maricaulis maris MCS10]|uniref:Alanine--tRNA ligase n=1 Tax=Maricaulis maris (strain MCS10) TaxID=394221 RepID=SYA_MARMM|nr:alanine--tRNA ligase [Maricaulis maris]Q0AQY6.1 RecName: Full=Alanine--tRNA ligase; AltName: Full=Alanyl-tRNA synthetase; Short=AlaRS [Maricaulis maris MCS10]ABI65301.1 alanyl-tRNA synthetase [Maricaulis maris MCS10]
MASLRDIRATFLDYFAKHEHEVVPSAPLVPQDDPTLLFVNAGMVPFKNSFTGQEKRASLRATSSQKCVRAGGKHNDLDNVGYTARHHTFFEMLGNFSFGDYFKEEAISHAWNLVTGEFGLPAEKLLVTVYAEDEQARALWRKIAGLTDDRIIGISTSDNFWSMGDTGPCGPCSEIFFDHGPSIAGGPPGSPDEDGDRFIEIWNLVFMQYEQLGPDERINLPKPSIDTGMGLERISAILQGKHNNYETDLFRNLIAAGESVLGVKAEGDALASHRVIADHLRSTCFLMADGVTPSNEGRGYVLRRIMRRAMRHAHLLGAGEPVMWKLVDALKSEMGDAYPELERAQALLEETLQVEEERFQRTLGRGLSLLEEATADMGEGDALAGATAFKLYDTYGFPLDLTQDALRAKGMTVDEAGFNSAMDKQRADARASKFSSGDAAPDAVWFAVRDKVGATAFTGYAGTGGKGRLTAIVSGGQEAKALGSGQRAELVFDETPFYGESGGQCGDTGEIRFVDGAVFTVEDTQKRGGDMHAHIGVLTKGEITLGDVAALDADAPRRAAIRANHSATHLAHAALRDVLGAHVTQKGSHVGPDRLRFDFSHNKSVSADQIAAIEAQVNAVIRQNVPVSTREMTPDAAIEAGALALFGEKYGDTVRVLAMGQGLADHATPYSVELCGGTHVERTGDIALFKIIAETAVSSGIRRIEAMTGEGARLYMDEQIGFGRAAADALKTPPSDLATRVAALVDERRKLERQLAEAKKQLAMGGGASGAPAGPETINGVNFIGRVVEGVGGKDLRGLIDEAKAQMGSGVAAFIGVNDGKAALAVGVTDDLKDRFVAVDLVKAGAAAVGGKGGGGRPDFAQAGGPDGAKANDGLAAIRAALAG